MSLPTMIAFAGAERSSFGVGPPAVPSRISRERLVDEAAATARVLPVAMAASEMPAACKRRRRERLMRGCLRNISGNRGGSQPSQHPIYHRHSGRGASRDPGTSVFANTEAKTLDYKVRPWTLPFGPAFGCSNSFRTNVSGFCPDFVQAPERRQRAPPASRLLQFRVPDTQSRVPDRESSELLVPQTMRARRFVAEPALLVFLVFLVIAGEEFHVRFAFEGEDVGEIGRASC